MPGADFEKAVLEVEKLNGEPSNDEKLRLYGLFKIAKGEEAKKPGMFDLVNKAKFNKWTELKDEYKTPEEGEKAYVATVEELKAKYGFDASRTTQFDGKAIDAEKLKKYEELSK